MIILRSTAAILEYQIQLLWPENLEAQLVFESLPIPNDTTASSTAYSFILEKVLPGCEANALIAALAWVERSAGPTQMEDYAAQLNDGVVSQAIMNMDNPDVTDALATAWITRLQHFQDFFDAAGDTRLIGDQALLSESQRRLMIGKLLRESLRRNLEPGIITFSRIPIVTSDDLPWLLEELVESSNPDYQNALALLARQLWYIYDPDHVALIYTTMRRSNAVQNAFAPAFAPVALDSEEAKQQRSYVQRRREIEAKRRIAEERRSERPPQVQALLERIMSGGEIQRWWQLGQELEIDPHCAGPRSGFKNDIRQLPGWIQSDEMTRRNILTAAKQYILHGEPEPPTEWFGTNTVYWSVYEGYRALKLIIAEEPAFLIQLPDGVWQKWIPAILTAPNRWGSDDAHTTLLTLASTRAREEFIRQGTLLLSQLDTQSIRSEAQVLGIVWVPEFTDVVWEMLERNRADHVRELLPVLLECDHGRAQQFVLNLLTDDVEADDALGIPIEAVQHAAAVLMSYYWQSEPAMAVKFLVEIQPHIAREALLWTAHGIHFRRRPNIESLAVEQIKELYLWLANHFPYEADPQRLPGIVYDMTPRDEVTVLREAVLWELQNRGTYDAVSAVQHLCTTFPEVEHLPRVLYFAHLSLLRNEWKPIEPDTFLRMAHDSSLRWIKTASDLLRVVCESLERLQLKINGQETPAAIDLWNEVFVRQGEFRYTPKDENRGMVQKVCRVPLQLKEQNV